MESAGRGVRGVLWWEWTYAKDTTILNIALEFSCASGDGGDTTGRHVFADC